MISLLSRLSLFFSSFYASIFLDCYVLRDKHDLAVYFISPGFLDLPLIRDRRQIFRLRGTASLVQFNILSILSLLHDGRL